MSEQYADAYLVDAEDVELARLALEEKDCPALQTPPADHRRRAA